LISAFDLVSLFSAKGGLFLRKGINHAPIKHQIPLQGKRDHWVICNGGQSFKRVIGGA
jgi:hypothetical protein